MMDAGGIAHDGIQPDGSYVPTREEAAADCNQLKGAIAIRVNNMRPLAQAAVHEEQSAAGTVVGVLGRAFGSKSGGNASVARFDQERARAERLNALLAEKRCEKVDLESQLAAELRMIEGARR